MLSVLIPSRNEQFLAPTVRDVLVQSRGSIEVIVALDGYWPDPPLVDDPRLNVLHWAQPRGVRPCIKAMVAVSKGEHLMKLDAHCALPEGFDTVLSAECDEEWVVVPRRHRLDPETWALQDVGKPPIDAHYLSYPYERPGDPSCGLHGTVWTERARAREHVLLDDEMSSQGSCWFMTRRHWERIVGPVDVEHYGDFIQEFQEVGLKTWLSGGQVKVNKKTWYAHLHKGRIYGRGYHLTKQEQTRGAVYCTDYWMHDRWPQRTRNLSWLIEYFWPVPGWPLDWERLPVASSTSARQPDILSARYGLSEQKSLDVTDVVRALWGSSFKVTNATLGVGNVHPGKRKTLFVTTAENVILMLTVC